VQCRVELEVNQAFPTGAPGTWRALRDALAISLAVALAEVARRPTGRPDGATNAMSRRPIPSMVSER
jgi:hypothetical protein